MAENITRITNLNDEQMATIAEFFKVFGDYTRVRVLAYIFDTDEVCVSDLAEQLGMTASAISHQLKILKQSKLVKARRDGKQIYYSLADEHITLIIEKAIEHVFE